MLMSTAKDILDDITVDLCDSKELPSIFQHVAVVTGKCGHISKPILLFMQSVSYSVTVSGTCYLLLNSLVLYFYCTEMITCNVFLQLK
jgi:hypothetical protein